MKAVPYQERFHEHYVPEPNTGCWLWTATVCQPFGHGRLAVGRTMAGAHRISWELHNGPIPEGMFVCHHCDVPSCVNPDHLFIGDNQMNMTDKQRKGRAVKGEGSAGSKLTEDDVRRIRRMADMGMTTRMISDGFPVTWQTVHDIIKRKKWSHVTDG